MPLCQIFQKFWSKLKWNNLAQVEIFRSKWSTSFDRPKNRAKPRHHKPLCPPQSCACERELLTLGSSILNLSPHPYMDGAHSYVTTWPFVGKSFDKSFLPALIFLVAWDQALKTFPNLQSTTRFTSLDDLFYFVFPVSCLFPPTTEPGPSLDSFENRVLPVICPGSSSIRKRWGGGVGVSNSFIHVVFAAHRF